MLFSLKEGCRDLRAIILITMEVVFARVQIKKKYIKLNMTKLKCVNNKYFGPPIMLSIVNKDVDIFVFC